MLIHSQDTHIHTHEHSHSSHSHHKLYTEISCARKRRFQLNKACAMMMSHACAIDRMCVCVLSAECRVAPTKFNTWRCHTNILLATQPANEIRHLRYDLPGRFFCRLVSSNVSSFALGVYFAYQPCGRGFNPSWTRQLCIAISRNCLEYIVLNTTCPPERVRSP